MKSSQKIQNYDFKFKEEYPQNIFKCQFFKIAADDVPGRQINKGEAYCSIRDEVFTDYKICCTKHDGNQPDNYLHCQSYLEKFGNMYDKDRLELRNLKLMKE